VNKRFLMTRFAIMAILITSLASSAQAAPQEPVDIARSYFEAMDRSDLDAAEALFAATSSVFETGGSEGTWQHYREHHLGPEIDAIKTFETTLGEPESEKSQDDSMAFVSWPIDYHIELDDGRVIDSKGTVTFVLVRQGEELRIRHLHWSSRRKK
jgi:hypothetical protein